MACKMIRLRKRQENYLNSISENIPDAIDIVIDGHKEAQLMKKMLDLKEEVKNG